MKPYRNVGIFQEACSFLWARKVWWMLPIIVTLLVVGFLLCIGQAGPASGFIYAMF